MNEDLIILRDEMRQGFADMRHEMAQFRQEMGQGLADVREEMGQGLADVRQEMGQGFADVRQEMGQGFADVREEMGQGFARVDQRLVQLDQDVIDLRQGLATLTRRVDFLEDRVRANGVLLEAIRDDVRQIAEAHVLLAQRVTEYRSENDAQRAILSLLQTSYRDLDRRVTRLEERAGETEPRPRA
jgi:chromosome segregation ATPase